YSEVDSQVIQTKKLNNYQKDKLHTVAQEAKSLHVRIVADKTVTLGGIRDAIRDTKKLFNVGLVVVDYLQMIAMPASYKSENRTRDIGVISRGLKDIAREYKCPVIALSSLSRAVEQRQDKRPMMSDLRESGDIESDADVIKFIYRAGYYERSQDGQQDEEDKAEVITAKNRNGKTGMSMLKFQCNFAKFSDYILDSFDL
ncbi:MAG: DnaB-like helicase C-terminal domain-containing protein, partial [Methylococcales bacterium]